jgi:hypothetical protein
MKVNFFAALLLGTMAAASSQANINLRGKKHHATDVSTTCTFDFRSGDVPTTDDWTNCSFEELFGPPPKKGPTTPSGNGTATMARDYWYYDPYWDMYYYVYEPPYWSWGGGSSKGHKGRKSAPTSSITTTNNKCEECTFKTVTGERMHAEITPGQCEEACVVAARKGRWEAAGWKCGPCSD